MGQTTKPTRKKFRVAVSGNTVDGREISSEHLKAAAKNYNPNVYGARVNVEHYLSPVPSSDFAAMGDVIALSTEDITEGPLAGRTALFAEIEPTERMKKLVSEGKKVYSSIELHPQSGVTDGPYLIGLAMTDTPASLGTERLKFTAQQRTQVMQFNQQQGDAPLITEAIEAEIIELATQQADEGKQWFARVMGLIGKGRQSDSEQFSQVRNAVENVAQSHADLLDRFGKLEQQHQSDTKAIAKLTTDLATLHKQLHEDANPSMRFTATGGSDNQQWDF
ncbi:Phage capsid scaffolding protein (GPO) serine peptidase [Edwardsiella tarda]|uniref:GPO family capsid scaffolding protein n=1 Tax=Edwardsiella tarda ATCC 15947 = NBRC 105688 TaxID=667121 RepID=A0AC61THZ9_EDWTA|nr:GPO family capsid scaffolding protein [Edwardsiella tarda]UAL56654.1 GPO family capsid scaffolding protein [Edwardsiella tarda]UCQ00292.1 GPO family capsid scaffolding protein [Edwardsiella tarda ATCC 15947 = NBRC 105688]STD27886.1 Phage capsid scaffolding protein (GPO) serine peptidase [Edwardsiella tarda]STE53199.1 Phage capsid scaffolding protein (GPO) serine peptidase [Edwardsiella tarda]